MDFTGGDTTVKQALKIPLHQQGQDILRDVAQVVDAVAVGFQLLHQLLHFAAGAQNVHPVVQHALHLKYTIVLLGVGQHPLVGLVTGKQAGIQQLPLLALKGQLADQLFRLGVAKAVHKVFLGVKIDHDAAKIKDDIFIHSGFLKSCLHFGCDSGPSIAQLPQLFPLFLHERRSGGIGWEQGGEGMTFRDLCTKEIVQLQNGVCLGKADDLEFDPQTAEITSLQLLGQPRLFGLMGREETLTIPWHEIERIGLDAILVRTELPVPEETAAKPAGFFAKLRRWLKG